MRPQPLTSDRRRRAARPGPALRAAAGAAVLSLLALTACSGDEARPTSGDEAPEPTPATGEADELTVVDTKHVPGLSEERTASKDGGVEIDVAYPTVRNAGPFAERLAEITEQDAADFAGAADDPKSYTVDWQLSVAGPGVMAVRLTQREKDGEGERTGYSTYWYDTESGHTAYSTELLGGQRQLDRLDAQVKKRLKDEDGVDVSTLHPIARLYDSIGFNPDGDLVVEFDEGQIAPVKDGRVHAVVPREDAEPLLSEFGERARSAAVVVTPEFRIGRAANAPKDGPPEGGVPGVMAAADSEVDCSDPESKCIALTFDDGPGARTPELLDALAEYDARATFFVTGGPVREHPDVVRREYAEGHEVANHTVHHPDLTSVGKDEIDEELSTVNELVRRETGYTMDLMRPPYGATDGQVDEVTERLGQAQILWSIDTNDWRDHNPGLVADRAVEDARPGSIVLMHDIHDTTIDAVPDILKRLDEKGYTMVTVSQLLGETEPGRSYIDGHPEPEESPSPSD
ncbi:polysaccharide deacetylase family protein [Streptomonospora nanhaiensis]|uniref:Peptidoglycan/xylan/chitin deacetylase (PgdA/CDA1 family) n=1 Tax=Streptomonospora nanhaiensis TaxID=1323731 RepID=A0A853BUI2_9ACTN|nr:polysaccharide deacetylase family protein [Streptomonospora nanhaiensis]NYI98773.1 peptidoglycan/xylan/chitin deacetylase (PgdA/CDA1 family) [Streptomonospora nanhaiensis]